MNNKFKDTRIKNRKYYFSNNIKIDEETYFQEDKSILIYYIGYVTIKDSKYAEKQV